MNYRLLFVACICATTVMIGCKKASKENETVKKSEPSVVSFTPKSIKVDPFKTNKNLTCNTTSGEEKCYELTTMITLTDSFDNEYKIYIQETATKDDDVSEKALNDVRKRCERISASAGFPKEFHVTILPPVDDQKSGRVYIYRGQEIMLEYSY